MPSLIGNRTVATISILMILVSAVGAVPGINRLSSQSISNSVAKEMESVANALKAVQGPNIMSGSSPSSAPELASFFDSHGSLSTLGYSIPQLREKTAITPASVTLGPWLSTSNYPLNIAGESCAAGSGIVYCVGGEISTAGSLTSSVYYGTLGPSGVGSWSSTTPYPFAISSTSCAAASGVIYCVAGTTSSFAGTNSVYYASLIPSGVGTWQATANYPKSISATSCTISSGTIYCVGGVDPLSGATTNAVYYAPLTGSGVGSWSQTTNYPQTVSDESCAVSAGVVYCVGGSSGSASLAAVNYAQTTGSGLGSWTTSTSYPLLVADESCVTSGGYIFCTGGYNIGAASATNSVDSAPLLPSVGSWSSMSNYPINDAGVSCLVSASVVYCVGGLNSGTTLTNAVYYGTIGGPFDYSLSNTSPVSITEGSSGSVAITATLTGGNTQSVNLSCANLPLGISCVSFNPAALIPTATSVLTVSVASSVSPGSYTFQVTGTPLGASTTPTTVSVMVMQRFDYSLSNDSPVMIAKGNSGTITITANLISGSTQPVTLSCINLPSGISCVSFSPPSVSPPASSVLAVSVASSVPPGTYSFQVTGSPLGATTTPTTVTVMVPAPFDYSLSNNGPVSIARHSTGSSGTVTIMATLTGGNAQSVTLSCVTPLPSGISCTSLNPASVNPTSTGASSTLTINAASSVSPGSYTFQVTGTPLGATTTPTTVTVIVQGFGFTLSSPSPTTLSVIPGSTSGSSSITATLTGGATQPITFFTSALPSGITAQFTNNPCNPTCTVTVAFMAAISTNPGSTSISIMATGDGLTMTSTQSLTLTVESWSTDPNFSYFSCSPSCSVSDTFNVGSSSTDTPLVSITVISPAPGVSWSLFVSDISQFFGFSYDPNAYTGKFVVLSINGLVPLADAIDSAYNSNLGWLFGDINLAGEISPLVDAQGNFNFFGFIELYNLTEGCSVVDLSTNCTLFSLANAMAQGLYAVIKANAVGVLDKLSALLSSFLAAMNFGVGILKPHGSVYSEYFHFGLDTIQNAVSAIAKLAMMSDYVKKIVELVTKIIEGIAASETIVGAIIPFGQALITGIDVLADYIAQLTGQSNGWVITALDWVTTIVDPNGATITVTLAGTTGQTILGYTPGSTFQWSLNRTGFVISTSDGWTMILTNSTILQQYQFSLSQIGNSTAQVPYITSISEGMSSVPATAAGSLTRNLNVNSTFSLGMTGGTPVAAWNNAIQFGSLKYSASQSGLSITGQLMLRGSILNGNVQLFMNSSLLANVTTANGAFQIQVAGSFAGQQLLLMGSAPGDYGTTTPLTIFNFSMSNSGDVTLNHFGNGSNTITVTFLGGLPESVSLSCSGLPLGVQCQSYPPNGTPSFSTALMIAFTNMTSTTTASQYKISVNGTSAHAISSTQFNLFIPSGTVGGITIEVNKIGLVLPYIAVLFSLAITALAVMFLRRTKLRRRGIGLSTEHTSLRFTSARK